MVLREHNLPDKSYSRAMLSLQKLVFDWLFHCVSIAAYLQAFLNFMMRLNIRLARRWKKSMIKDNMKHYKLWSSFWKKVPIFFLSATWIFCTTSSQSWQIRSITPKALAQFVAGKPQTDFCTVVIEQNSGDLYKHYIFYIVLLLTYYILVWNWNLLNLELWIY